MAGPRASRGPCLARSKIRHAMLPFPPPLLPEPITVPNNVADGDYDTRVRFVRTVGIGHLLSLAILAIAVGLFMHPTGRLYVAEVGAQVIGVFSAVCLILLAAVRHSKPLWQLLVFLAFLLSFSAWMGTAVLRLHESYPAFTESLGIGIATAWVAVLLYNVLCGRDYSFVGEFTISFLAVCVAVWLYGKGVRLDFSETLAVLSLCALALGYWTYDLAMILGRRTSSERLAAILDLYRDVLNFLGFPVRILRMPRRKGRSII